MLRLVILSFSPLRCGRRRCPLSRENSLSPEHAGGGVIRTYGMFKEGVYIMQNP